MTWSLVGSAHAGNSSSSVSIAKPAGVQAGDLLLISALNYNGQCASSGFTLIAYTNGGVTYARLTTLYRIADGTEGASFTLTGASPIRTEGIIAVYRSDQPITLPPLQAGTFALDSTSVTIPEAASTEPSLVIFAASIADDVPPGLPGGYSPAIGTGGSANASSFALLHQSYRTVDTSVTVGGGTTSLATPEDWASQTVVFGAQNPSLPAQAEFVAMLASSSAPDMTSNAGANATMLVASETATAPNASASGGAGAAIDASADTSLAPAIGATAGATTTLPAIAQTHSAPAINASGGSAAQLVVTSEASSADAFDALGTSPGEAFFVEAIETSSAASIVAGGGSSASLAQIARTESAPVITASGGSSALFDVENASSIANDADVVAGATAGLGRSRLSMLLRPGETRDRNGALEAQSRFNEPTLVAGQFGDAWHVDATHGLEFYLAEQVFRRQRGTVLVRARFLELTGSQSQFPITALSPDALYVLGFGRYIPSHPTSGKRHGMSSGNGLAANPEISDDIWVNIGVTIWPYPDMRDGGWWYRVFLSDGNIFNGAFPIGRDLNNVARVLIGGHSQAQNVDVESLLYIEDTITDGEAWALLNMQEAWTWENVNAVLGGQHPLTSTGESWAVIAGEGVDAQFAPATGTATASAIASTGGGAAVLWVTASAASAPNVSAQAGSVASLLSLSDGVNAPNASAFGNSLAALVATSLASSTPSMMAVAGASAIFVLVESDSKTTFIAVGTTNIPSGVTRVTNVVQPGTGAFAVKVELWRADRYGTPIERIPVALPVQGSLSFNEDTQLKHTLELEFNNPNALTPFRDFLIPVITMIDASGRRTERRKGHYVVTPPSTRLTSGRFSGTIRGESILWILQNDTLPDGLVLDEPMDAGVIARQIALDANINPRQLALPDTGVVLDTVRMPPGITRLDAINELYTTAGHYTVWTMDPGSITTMPYRDLQTTVPLRTLRSRDGGVSIVPPIKEDPEWSRLRNRVTVRNVRPDQDPIYATVDVTDPGSPVHRDNLGVVRADTITDSQVTDAATALARAKALLADSASWYRKLSTRRILDLDAGAHDVLALDVALHGASYTGNWLQRTWSMELRGVTAITEAELTRVERVT